VLPELHLVDGHAAEHELKDAMSELSAGVVLVTCSVEGRVWGTTVTSFASVALAPPTVLVSLRTDSTAAGTIAVRRRFGVSLLAERHLELARACSVPGVPKFISRDALAGTLAALECVVVRAVVLGDQTVFFARVESAWSDGAGEPPLVYHRRRYAC
jgi:flavin reductase (DIM6/NTAB) family NADH-FMN oxidoreductase RutF